MPKCCSVYSCDNRHSSKDEKGKQTHSFYVFPSAEKQPERRKLWAKACRRKDPLTQATWAPKDTVKYVYVCSDHFITGKPVDVPDHPDYVPNQNIFNTSHRAKPTHYKHLNFISPSSLTSANKLDRFKRLLKRQKMRRTLETSQREKKGISSGQKLSIKTRNFDHTYTALGHS